MNSEWPLISIDELKRQVAIGPFGSRMKSDCYVSDGVRVVRGTNLMDGRELSGEFVFIPSEKAKELGNCNLVPGDLVFPHRGSIGEVGIIPEDRNKYILSSSLMKLSCDYTKAEPLFIYYFFKSAIGRFELLKNASQVGTPGIGQPLTSLKSIKLRLPPINQQKAIVSILTALDDRMDLLRKTNSTLEAIAQALFKSWFIDFDPVRAKAEGREPEGIDAETAALFPDSFEESELGLVPQGWKVGCVSDFACLKKGSINPLLTPDILFEHYSLPAFDSAQMPVFENGCSIKSNKTPLPDEAILLSKLNPRIPRIWLPVKHGDNAVCSTEFLAFSPVEVSSKEFIYSFFCSPEFSQRLCQMVTGTSNSHQRVRADQISALDAIIPTENLFIAFTNVVKPMFEKLFINRNQARTLATLRDMLLPRLISGQLTLPETKKTAEINEIK